MAKWSVIVWAAVTADLATMIDLDIREADIALRSKTLGIDVDVYQQRVWHGPVGHISWRDGDRTDDDLPAGYRIATALSNPAWVAAEHRLLVLWGHGAQAFPAGLLDETTPELVKVPGGDKIAGLLATGDLAMPDIVGYDACRMASLKTVFSLARDAALSNTIFVASMVPEPASGWPYFESLKVLTGDWSDDSEAVASGLVEAYAAAVDTADWSIVALHLGRVADLAVAWDEFLAQELPSTAPNSASVGERFFAAAAGADIPDDLNLADVGALMQRLDALNPKAHDVRDKLLAAIITRRDGGRLVGRDGVSVHVRLPPLAEVDSWQDFFVKEVNSS